MGHLILTRRLKEGFVLLVGDVRIRVELCRLGREDARIGIEAPDEVAIFRDELLVDGKPRSDGARPDPKHDLPRGPMGRPPMR